jgi:hypothetical protein
MAVRHAMLVIARAVSDIVEIPGTEPLVVPAGSGESAARDWWVKHEEAAAAARLEEYNASVEERFVEWDAGTEIEFAKGRIRVGAPRVDLAQITFPDGTEDLAPLDSAADFVAQVFRARNPQPTMEAQYSAWRHAVRVAELWTWTARLHDGTKNSRVDIGQPALRSGYPIDEVLRSLDSLSADGWEVTHVSEDRGQYAGSGGSSETAVITARYLLTRPA